MSLGNLPDRQYLTLTLRCTPLSFLPCTDFLIGNSLLNSTNLSCSEMSHREPVFDSARLKLGPRFISALVAATVQVDQANKHGKGSRQAAKGHGRGSGNTADAVEWNIISCIETAAAHVADTAMASAYCSPSDHLVFTDYTGCANRRNDCCRCDRRSQRHFSQRHCLQRRTPSRLPSSTKILRVTTGSLPRPVISSTVPWPRSPRLLEPSGA